jgi:hypothetical protein
MINPATTQTTRTPQPTTQRITVAADCLICGDVTHITGTKSAWDKWRNGEWTADRAFAQLPVSDRLWLTSGICPKHIEQHR